ncbi:hypothetical protein CXB51_029872 [Gossypium anomalum]|uniref:DUF4283 domain-containing protein n=1 Tax=Gossypium anomalum TaxID=47600 RepID=A0A8J5YL71_9ROSI|nr:hypothetical protein CXB51_029872 [Gossypium anomalum]
MYPEFQEYLSIHDKDKAELIISPEDVDLKKRICDRPWSFNNCILIHQLVKGENPKKHLQGILASVMGSFLEYNVTSNNIRWNSFMGQTCRKLIDLGEEEMVRAWPETIGAEDREGLEAQNSG